MTKVKTFLDAGVLLTAWRGLPGPKADAVAVLNDPQRSFVSSAFVELEVLPKAIYYKQQVEAAFYLGYFKLVEEWVMLSPQLADDAKKVAGLYGLNAIDALHIAAALQAVCAQFITYERKTSPLSRVQGIQVLMLR
jgi:hypothetical protein